MKNTNTLKKKKHNKKTIQTKKKQKKKKKSLTKVKITTKFILFFFLKNKKGRQCYEAKNFELKLGPHTHAHTTYDKTHKTKVCIKKTKTHIQNFF